MSHVYRWHPHVTAGPDGPLVQAVPLHLQQSDLDGACGLHCALMALMLFGLVERHELARLGQSSARTSPLAQLWKGSAPHYFSGLRPRKLKALLKPYQKQLTCTLATGAPGPETAATVQADGVGLLAILHRDFAHWILAMGVGGEDGHPDTDKLLILDPSLPPIPLLPWNATLTVNARRSGRHRYTTVHGDDKVSVEDALLLRPRPNREEVEADFDQDAPPCRAKPVTLTPSQPACGPRHRWRALSRL